MPIVAALWLALIHALFFVAPPRLADGAAKPRAGIEQTIERRRLATVPAEAPEEALRAARIVAVTAISRTPGPATVGAGNPAALLQPAWLAVASLTARQALRRHGAVSHALAARGSVLPYFPTAPPRQA
jgi:hypothetical protein